ncbi:hypothetical protein SAMN04488047_12719 [Tranquillimonas alkanivorans]|uniref:Uncharacterized protein n=1 Tax=Tranquillimonas alkanivorans TaxID=441119 RepID=A0A1I5V6C5_9RHOB|nr:hypothetical protein SAMN04488047_12719 [Tranquillimonas alkanivorans]
MEGARPLRTVMGCMRAMIVPAVTRDRLGRGMRGYGLQGDRRLLAMRAVAHPLHDGLRAHRS